MYIISRVPSPAQDVLSGMNETICFEEGHASLFPTRPAKAMSWTADNHCALPKSLGFPSSKLALRATSCMVNITAWCQQPLIHHENGGFVTHPKANLSRSPFLALDQRARPILLTTLGKSMPTCAIAGIRSSTRTAQHSRAYPTVIHTSLSRNCCFAIKGLKTTHVNTQPLLACHFSHTPMAPNVSTTKHTFPFSSFSGVQCVTNFSNP
jgi:hypothetical protein